MSNLNHNIKQLKLFNYNAGLKFGEIERKELLAVEILRFNPSGYIIERGRYNPAGDGEKESIPPTTLDVLGLDPLKQDEVIRKWTRNEGWRSMSIFDCKADENGNLIYYVWGQTIYDTEDGVIKTYEMFIREIEYYQ
ncbi:MAG: hypothetical protein ACOYMF_05175 [Bacteroidales bacterium]